MGFLTDDVSQGRYFRGYQAPQQAQPTAQPKQGFNLGNLLSSIVDPFKRTANTLQGGEFEVGRFLNSLAPKQAQGALDVGGNIVSKLFPALGKGLQSNYLDPGAAKANPYLDIEKVSKDPKAALTQQVQDSLNLASYAVPFGKAAPLAGAAGQISNPVVRAGANALTKFALPGLEVNALQKLSEGKNPLEGGLESAATSTALGELGGPLSKIFGKKTETVARGLEKAKPTASSNLVASTLNVPNINVAAELKPQEVTAEVMAHNPPVSTVGGLKKWIAQVSGKGGAPNKFYEDSVARIKGEVPVESAFSAASEASKLTGGALTKEEKIAERTAIEETINKTISSKNLKPIGTLNPLDAVSAARELRDKGWELLNKSRRYGEFNSSKLEARASIYLAAADDLFGNIDRIGSEQGVLKAAFNDEAKKSLSKFSDRALQQVQAAVENNSLADVRSVSAPFNNFSRLLNLTERGGQTTSPISSNLVARMLASVIAGGAGGALLGPVGAVGGAISGPLVEQGIEKSRLPIALALAKGGGVGERIAGAFSGGEANPIVETLLGQLGARAGVDLTPPPDVSAAPGSRDFDATQGAPAELTPNNQEQPGFSIDTIDQRSQNPYPIENFISDIQRDPKNAQLYQFIFQQYQKEYAPEKPKALSTTAARNIALANAGLDDLQNVQSLLQSDQLTLLKQLLPGKKLSAEYDAAANRLAEAIVRIESGANAPAAEIKRYRDEYLPKFGESQAAINSKLRAAKKKLEDNLRLNYSTTDTQDYSALLGMLGAQ